MRILYVHRGYFPHSAGAEMMTYCVAGEMQRLGHQVGILCQGSGNDVELSEYDGIELIPLSEVDLFADEIQLPWKPDIIHVVDAVWPGPLRVGCNLAHKLNVPFVITPASTIDVWADVSATLAICRQADLVYVLTPIERAQFLATGLRSEQLSLIGQGAYLRGIPEPAAFRSRYQIVGPMVLFLGRKVEFKGYKRLLQAMAFVWEHHPETTFVYIGTHVDEDCEQTFRRYADPRVIEISSIDEGGKYSALMASDLVCLPSTADVFPLVFVEAWTCSKPVIAALYPGVEEIIQHGLDGLIVPAQPDAIAAAIDFLLTYPDMRKRMGDLGRIRVTQEFTWARIAETIEKSYEHLRVSFSMRAKA